MLGDWIGGVGCKYASTEFTWDSHQPYALHVCVCVCAWNISKWVLLYQLDSRYIQFPPSPLPPPPFLLCPPPSPLPPPPSPISPFPPPFLLLLPPSTPPPQIDVELAEAISQNTRRYISIFSDAISELLPLYKQREVRAVGGASSDEVSPSLRESFCQECWSKSYGRELCFVALSVHVTLPDDSGCLSMLSHRTLSWKLEPSSD